MPINFFGVKFKKNWIFFEQKVMRLKLASVVTSKGEGQLSNGLKIEWIVNGNKKTTELTM